MSEKAFRLDFFIAVAALLISAISAIALIYQTRVVADQARVAADQYAATIWPYLAVASTYSPKDGEVLSVENNGVGPALIRSAQLSIDGKPVTGWSAYLAMTERAGGSISASSFGHGDTLRAGESKTLLAMNLAPAALRSLIRHKIALDFCYCSLNKSCWRLHSDQRSGASDPQPLAACETAASIAAPNT